MLHYPMGGNGWWTDRSLDIWDEIVSLAELVATTEGRSARQSDEDITLFANNLGLGIQFAVAGIVTYVHAREQGLGIEEPVSKYTHN